MFFDNVEQDELMRCTIGIDSDEESGRINHNTIKKLQIKTNTKSSISDDLNQLYIET